MKVGVAIVLIVAALAGCADKEVNCDGMLKNASEAGYKQAISDIKLENIQYLRGEQLACRVYAPLPAQLQNLAGLDCSAKWPDGLENASAKMQFLPALVLFLTSVCIYGVWIILLPAIGTLLGNFRGAVALKIEPLRQRIIEQALAEATARSEAIAELDAISQSDLDALKAQIQREKSALIEAEDRARQARDQAQALEHENAAFRQRLESQMTLAKKAESTTDLANLLGQIGRKN